MLSTTGSDISSVIEGLLFGTRSHTSDKIKHLCSCRRFHSLHCAFQYQVLRTNTILRGSSLLNRLLGIVVVQAWTYLIGSCDKWPIRVFVSPTGLPYSYRCTDQTDLGT